VKSLAEDGPKGADLWHYTCFSFSLTGSELMLPEPLHGIMSQLKRRQMLPSFFPSFNLANDCHFA
jgi:hypothetical protein